MDMWELSTFLLGLLREGEGVAAQVLDNLGVDLDRARSEVLELLGGRPPGPSQRPEAPGACRAEVSKKEGERPPLSSTGATLRSWRARASSTPLLAAETRLPG